MKISRRTFMSSVAAAALPGRVTAQHTPELLDRRETLYNGIVLPRVWPPRYQSANDQPAVPSYLMEPPAVIPIDVGRQLFVDDFLIEQSTLLRTYHQPAYHPASPILRPETEWEKHDEYADRTQTPPNPTAMVFSDGVFVDPQDGLFKMWYMGGYRMNTCYAVSRDGVQWHRPNLDVRPGTNIVRTSGRDSGTVWLDHATIDSSSRFKMALFHDRDLSLHMSPDGVHWTKFGDSGPAGDRTTFFYNPFRRKWVFSIRAASHDNRGRYREYWEHDDFSAAVGWRGQPPVAWTKADDRDFARPTMAKEAELYNLDCVAYESVLLGLFNIWRGESRLREKINEITVGYSRDGFHWVRPDRRSFMPVSEQPGTWNYSNIQSAGGGCLVVGDELFFYVSGRTGIEGTDLPGTCSTGIATLRRDGFASMDWLPDDPRPRRVLEGVDGRGMLLTRPLRFSGSHLFVNADSRGGELRVEVLDDRGRVLPDFAAEDCIPVHEDGTKQAVTWKNANLQSLAGRPVRLRFLASRGRLFAFWVSRWPSGESSGFVAGGGPGFSGPVDSR
jgi:hypothetical protein